MNKIMQVKQYNQQIGLKKWNESNRGEHFHPKSMFMFFVGYSDKERQKGYVVFNHEIHTCKWLSNINKAREYVQGGSYENNI